MGLALAIGAAGFAADLAAKTAAIARLDPSTPVPLIPGALYLHLIRNPGAAFSMGENLTVFLTALAIGAVCFLLAWMVPRVRHVGWTVVTGLLLAGVSGNLFDRLTREPGAFRGHVIDFLQVPYFAIFNVADIWISAAAVLVVWLTLITKVTMTGEPSEPSAAAAAAPAADEPAETTGPTEPGEQRG